MVAPRYRSRTYRRVYVKTPGGRVVLQYKKRKPSHATCAECSAPLSGVPRVRARELHNLPKSAKRPERPYGGMLCSTCSRHALVEKTRASHA